MSILAVLSSELHGCFAMFVFMVSLDCCVALLHDTTGLSAVCDCGISLPYSLFWYGAPNSTTAESRAMIWCQWNAVRSGAVVLLLLTFCLLLLPLWESVIVLCFVVRYFMSILALQSS